MLVALPGYYGKPRPVLVVQPGTVTASGYGSVMVCPLSSHPSGDDVVRVAVNPTPENGLRLPSEIAVEKAIACPLDKLRDTIGHVDDVTLRAVERAIAIVFGLGAGRR